MAENVDAIPSDMVKSSDSPQRVSKRSSWRLQRRDELLMLRKAEKHLSAELQQLKHTMRMKSQSLRANKQLDSLIRGASRRALSWEEICGRQIARRRKSEEENKKLKEEMTLKYVKRMNCLKDSRDDYGTRLWDRRSCYADDMGWIREE